LIMLQLTSSPRALSTAVNLLRAGELVALPFETVYGLAGDATNPDALRAIFRAKGRPADHPLIVHLASAEQLPDWAAAVPEAAWRLASVFWPGPLTLVLPAARTVSPLVTGGQTTVALRVPAHPVPQAVLLQLGRALAAPSANPFGQISPTTAAHVRSHLAGKIAAVVDGGPCAVGIESTIVDLSSEHPRILRTGAITAEMLAAYLSLSDTVAAAAPRVPGALASLRAAHTVLPDPGGADRSAVSRPAYWAACAAPTRLAGGEVLADASAARRLCARALRGLARGGCEQLRDIVDCATAGRTGMGGHTRPLAQGDPISLAARAIEQNL
jgi:L-threonylcarbamoyladenylate synthase